MSAQTAAGPRPGSVQLVTLTAALAWILLHTGHAIAYRELHRQPALLGLAVVVALTALAVVLAPLARTEEPVLGRGLAIALGLATVGVAGAVQPFLEPAGITGYANWPVSAMSVLIAALTMRHRAGVAALTALGVITVNSVCIWHCSRMDTSVTLPDGVYLAVPPVTWWLAAFLVRTTLDRSAHMTADYRRRQLDLDAEALVGQALRESDDHRRTELRSRVLPLLHRLRDHRAAVDDETRAEAHRVALSLRDDLKARSLLTSSLRGAVEEARARGVWVSLSCDADVAQCLLEVTRAGLVAALPATPAGSTVSCRVTTAPAAAVVVLSGLTPQYVGPLGARFQEAAGVPGGRVEVEELENEMLAQLTCWCA